jgi:hypothetical protein
MSGKEYNLWIADYHIEPWGDARNDLQVATIVQSNLIPHSKKAIKLKDCMLNFEPAKKKNPKEIFAMFKGYTMAMGGKVT